MVWVPLIVSSLVFLSSLLIFASVHLHSQACLRFTVEVRRLSRLFQSGLQVRIQRDGTSADGDRDPADWWREPGHGGPDD